MIGIILKKRYHITDTIGSGAMGDVYLATDIQMEQQVAIKVLPPILARDPKYLQRFEREAQALSELEHPHIVPFVEYFTEDDNHYIVMAYMPGGSLLDRLQREGGLPVNKAQQIAIDLTDALIRAHRMGITHRDIKPENILFDKDGSPRLSDFGVAGMKQLEGTRLTQTGAQVGTPFYMAPEAWQGSEIGNQADIWSLGIVFYEMLVGELPFKGNTGIIVMRKILQEPTPDLRKHRKEVPKGFAEIVRKMLAKDPQQRYQHIREVGADLQRGEPLEPLRGSGMIQDHSPRRRLLLAGLLVMGPLIALVGFILGSGILENDDSANALSGLEETSTGLALLPTNTETASPTKTSTPTLTPSPTKTETSTSTATNTATATFSLTPTSTATNTATASPTHTLTPTATRTIDMTATAKSIEDATATANFEATQLYEQIRDDMATQQAEETATRIARTRPDLVDLSDLVVESNYDWEVFIQDFDGVLMAFVPKGCFTMGSNAGEADELPQHEQCIDAPFWIDREEVSLEQFDAFEGQATYAQPREETDQRVLVTWVEAMNYCRQRGGRLPTEAEWEYAVIGPDSNEGTGWIGALSLVGGVWEWTSSAYLPYPYAADDGREDTSRLDLDRVIRGGATGRRIETINSHNRRSQPPLEGWQALGFRCARDYVPPGVEDSAVQEVAALQSVQTTSSVAIYALPDTSSERLYALGDSFSPYLVGIDNNSEWAYIAFFSPEGLSGGWVRLSNLRVDDIALETLDTINPVNPPLLPTLDYDETAAPSTLRQPIAQATTDSGIIREVLYDLDSCTAERDIRDGDIVVFSDAAFSPDRSSAQVVADAGVRFSGRTFSDSDLPTAVYSFVELPNPVTEDPNPTIFNVYGSTKWEATLGEQRVSSRWLAWDVRSPYDDRCTFTVIER